MLNRKLLSLLISLLLTLSPFASLDVAAAVTGNGRCMMMNSGGDNAVVGLQQAKTTANHTASACEHCKNDSCNGDACNNEHCADYGCSAGNGLVSLLRTLTMPIQHYDATRHLASVGTGLLSHSSPPLLRPPV